MKDYVDGNELYEWGACGEVEDVLDQFPDRRIPLTHEALDELEDGGTDTTYWMGNLVRKPAVWARYVTVARHELAAEIYRHTGDSEAGRRLPKLVDYLGPRWRLSSQDSARALVIRMGELWGDEHLAAHWMLDIILRARAGVEGGDGDS